MSELSTEISAVRAAWLIRVSAKTVYQWIRLGKLDARKEQRAGSAATWMIRLDDLANMPGVQIDNDRLQQLSVPATAQRLEHWMIRMEARMQAYESGQEELKRQIALLIEAVRVNPQASLQAPGEVYAGPVLSPPSSPAPPLPAGYMRPGQRGDFLALHGWPRGTTRGWVECPMGPPAAVLAWALRHEVEAGYRAGRGHVVTQCDVPECPCHELMKG